MINSLDDKYRVPAPRYTSYPTVPYWDEANFDLGKWKDRLVTSFNESNEGISLYIHLPFCENLCTYCGCNTRITKNHGVEIPYINAILKEWELYLTLLGTKPMIKDIHLGGGTPTFFNPENLELLIKGILSSAGVHPEAKFSFEGHPGNTTMEHLTALYGLGFRRISLGIQDFDLKVQAIINRIQSYESVDRVTKLAREIGYDSVNYDLIYGLPLQSLSGLSNTIEDVIRLQPDRIAFYSYAHVPWARPGQRRYTEEHLPSPSLKAQLYEMGRERLTKAGYIEIGMDNFILPGDSLCQAEKEGKLHRNFMGYTEQFSSVMIGLGVSSISDCQSAFAQNVKTVEAYIDTVNAGCLPVFKGHILDDQDLLFRKHILNIMCNGSTSWSFAEAQNEEMELCLERAITLAQDGLILLSAYELRVTPLGKKFLRNICMAFDVRLWANKPRTQLFSMAD